MTLTGILKNILLVIISVLIWRTNISPLQVLGYAIALAGLLYYSLGWDQLVLLAQAAWAFAKGDDHQHYRSGLPSAVRRTLVMAVAAVVLLFLVGGFFWSAGPAEELAAAGTA
jgi:hypothetical protein